MKTIDSDLKTKKCLHYSSVFLKNLFLNETQTLMYRKLSRNQKFYLIKKYLQL